MPYPAPRRFWVRLISRVSFRAVYEHQDWTVRKLSEKSGVNRSTIGHLLSGRRETCLPANAKAIARAMGVPTEALFFSRLSTVSLDARRKVAS